MKKLLIIALISVPMLSLQAMEGKEETKEILNKADSKKKWVSKKMSEQSAQYVANF